MKSSDLWLAAVALRCGVLLAFELGCFLFVVPTLFDLHSSLADAAAALLSLVAVAGGLIWGATLTREVHRALSDKDHE